MKTVKTKYGTITRANSDFGYGYVYLSSEGIEYRDCTTWKTWKTVKGFENWITKQNKMCGGVYDRIETRKYTPRNTVLSW